MTEKPHERSMYRFEIVRHMLREPQQKISSPEDIREYFTFMEQYDREYIVRVDLNNAHEMTGYETVSIGTDDSANAGPKEIFRGACPALAGLRMTGPQCYRDASWNLSS